MDWIARLLAARGGAREAAAHDAPASGNNPIVTSGIAIRFMGIGKPVLLTDSRVCCTLCSKEV